MFLFHKRENLPTMALAFDDEEIRGFSTFCPEFVKFRPLKGKSVYA